MSELKYTYALDSTKTFLVHIDDARKGEIYYCPYSECNEILSIKEGKDRRKHFFHVNNGKKCSYNNYLHSLAERRIVEWFYSSNDITLKLNVDFYCANYNFCKWENNNTENSYCKKRKLSPFNLKKYYNCIEIEKRENGFIWDLWLTNRNINHPPMAIEIYVTHKCEDIKVNSDVKFIEIKIKNENELEMLINSNDIVECDNISFYNFKPKPKYENSIGNLRLNKFILYANKKAGFKVIDCNSFFKREYNSIYELTFDYYARNGIYYERVFNAFYLACAKAYTKYPDFKHCSLCKYYKYNESYNQHICILYKNLNLEDKHAGTNAITCKKYNVNQEFIQESVKYLSKLSLDEWTKDNK